MVGTGGAGGASIESVTQDVGQLVAATDTLTVSLNAGQTAGVSNGGYNYIDAMA